jgi:hypothetical protein
MSPTWQGLFEVRRIDEQDQAALLETVTPGYTFLNAMVGYRFFFGPVITDLFVRGTNSPTRKPATTPRSSRTSLLCPGAT